VFLFFCVFFVSRFTHTTGQEKRKESEKLETAKLENRKTKKG